MHEFLLDEMITPSLALGAGSLILSVLGSSATASDASYGLVETWQGQHFLDFVNFYTGSDPTNGFVTYLDQQSAQSAGLVKLTDVGSLYLGVDHNTTLNPGGKGRDSVRIGSKKYYDQSLVIADIAHMPGSVCGTWPAFWSVGKQWPGDGEIDIIEGVNKQDHNEIVMHTSGTCSLTDKGMSGAVNATGCGEDLGTVGCVVEDGEGSYGTSFNQQGGGVYAMQWTDQFLKIWFFPRHSIPPSISTGVPDVTQFGTPVALVQDSCDVANSFKAQSFIFDITFCGDWAGGVFGESGCPMSDASPLQSCVNYVAQNPSQFEQSYWEINYVKIYQTGVKGATSISSASQASAPQAPAEVPVSTPAPEAAATTHSATPAFTKETTRPGATSGAPIDSAPISAPTAASPPIQAPDNSPGKIYVTDFVTSTTTICRSAASSSATPTAASPLTEAPDNSPSKIYVTNFVTSTTTICRAAASSSAAVAVNSVPALAPSLLASGVPESTASGQSEDVTGYEIPNTFRPNNGAETAIGQQNTASHGTEMVPATTATQTTQTVHSDTTNSGSSADAASNHAANGDSVPSLASGPGALPAAPSKTANSRRPGPASSIPVSGASRISPSLPSSDNSVSIIPVHSSNFAPSGSNGPNVPSVSPTSTSPVFTGAANKLSGSGPAFVFAVFLAMMV